MTSALAITAAITMTITAYTDCDLGMWPCDGITASGIPTRPGVCACGPSYPFGTVFCVPALKS